MTTEFLYARSGETIKIARIGAIVNQAKAAEIQAQRTTDYTDNTDKNLQLARDTLPFKLGVLKIQEQSQLSIREVEIADHLGDVGVVEASDDLGIVDNEVWN